MQLQPFSTRDSIRNKCNCKCRQRFLDFHCTSKEQCQTWNSGIRRYRKVSGFKLLFPFLRFPKVVLPC